MSPSLIVHVIHRLGVGGLENGLVNLINHLPPEKYRHAIVSLTESTDFKNRIHRPDVEIHEMHKREGQDFGLYVRLYRLFKRLQPNIVHTRNLATLECQLPSWLACVPIRIHGEHGWDVFDPSGTNRKYQWLRKAFRPLIHRYVPLSCQLEAYLRDKIGVSEDKLTRICNGVDTTVFSPPKRGKVPIPGCPFDDPGKILIGTVGRMHGVKDQVTLVRAFVELLRKTPQFGQTVRLVCIGDGPLRTQCMDILEQSGLGRLAWFPGERNDIAEILRGLDVFVLPSRAEGISNTLLEAMATGLPVVATRVGGNPELVEDGRCGYLVPPNAPALLSDGLARYVADSGLRRSHGSSALARVRENFSLDLMLSRYTTLYDQLLQRKL